MKTLKTFIATQRNMSSEEYNSLVGMGDDLYHEIYSVYGNEEVGFYHIGHNKVGGYELDFYGHLSHSEDLELLEQILWDGLAKHEIGISEEYEKEDLHERARNLIEKVCYNCSLDEIPLSVFNKTELRQRNYLLGLFENNFNYNTLLSNDDPQIEGYAVIRQSSGVYTFFEFSDDEKQHPTIHSTMKGARSVLADHIINLANEFKNSDMECIDNNLYILPAVKLGESYKTFNGDGDIVVSHNPKVDLPIKSYDIEVCRISYAHRTITVKAASLEEAQNLALEEAGDFEFSESEVDYSLS